MIPTPPPIIRHADTEATKMQRTLQKAASLLEKQGMGLRFTGHIRAANDAESMARECREAAGFVDVVV